MGYQRYQPMCRAATSVARASRLCLSRTDFRFGTPNRTNRPSCIVMRLTRARHGPKARRNTSETRPKHVRHAPRFAESTGKDRLVWVRFARPVLSGGASETLRSGWFNPEYRIEIAEYREHGLVARATFRGVPRDHWQRKAVAAGGRAAAGAPGAQP